ncbi:MAG: amino acid ABC transporter permease [Coriobacteriia bacterium]|nr:amino acid ABC transporter permease [Coriobacteriia bacterium]
MALLLLLVSILAPLPAVAATDIVAEASFVPITATIDVLDVSFTVPPGEFQTPVDLLIEFPPEMNAAGLRGTGMRLSDKGDTVRPPAISASEKGVTFSFTASVPPAGTVFDIQVLGLATPEQAGPVVVPVKYGEAGSLQPAGEFTIDIPKANILQRVFRGMEKTPFLHQFFSPTIIWGSLPLLWRGFQVAVLILFVSYAFGIPLGLTFAFMKMSRLAIVRIPATVAIDIIRGTPMLVQLLLVYFGITYLPAWNSLMSALGPLAEWQIYAISATQFFRAIIVLSVNSSAYMAEIFRAGIQSIHKGQLEAARSLGMSWPQAMAYVIVPQTVRRVLPTMMSEFILLFKDTSILFAVGIFELTLQARTIQAAKFNMSPYIAAAGFYLMLTVPLGRFVARLEQRLSVAETGRGGKKRGKPKGPLADKPVPEEVISATEVGLR